MVDRLVHMWVLGCNVRVTSACPCRQAWDSAGVHRPVCCAHHHRGLHQRQQAPGADGVQVGPTQADRLQAVGLDSACLECVTFPGGELSCGCVVRAELAIAGLGVCPWSAYGWSDKLPQRVHMPLAASLKQLAIAFCTAPLPSTRGPF